jgi:hypothetical protein
MTAACSGSDPAAPTHLLDDSLAPQLPVRLEGVGAQQVLTRVRVVPLGEVETGSPSASCLHGTWDGVEPAERIVERTGVAGETVTFRDRTGEGLYGCDNDGGSSPVDHPWCGVAFGRLYSGRLRDPRLDLGGCGTEGGDPLGFAWISPGRDTSYLAVDQPGYAEVYRVSGQLPVRVATTTGVEVEHSRATFDLSEHDAEGGLLRRHRLTAAVAG